MPRAYRLPVVRLCLLFLAAVLASVALPVLAASADPSRAAAALPTTGLSVPAAQSVSKRRASHGKSLRARRAECAAAARAEKHRKARKACAVKKAKGKGTKPSASSRPVGTALVSSPFVAPPNASAPVVAGPPPEESLAVPAPEATPPAETSGGSDKPPVESKVPATPVEESKPSAGEEKAKVEKANEVKTQEEQKSKEEKVAEERAEEEKLKEEKNKEDEKPKELSIAVNGNNLVNGDGKAVTLHGVNISGTEWQCLYGHAFYGPHNEESIAAIAAWHVNAVRIPLNEDCWLGINGAPTDVNVFHEEIRDYVEQLHAHGMYAILDLHWSAPGNILSHLGPGFEGYFEMADETHAPAFWASVASYFKEDHAVLFDLFNEPKGISWSCWLNGCVAPRGYQTAGMQQLVDVVREAGATQPIMAGGLESASELGNGWLDNHPVDPIDQLVASVHVYDENSINRFNTNIGVVASKFPVVAGELGETDCSDKDLQAFLPWADEHGVSYVAWAWFVGSCTGYPSLISEYNGTPTNYGIGYREHLLAKFPAP